VCTTDLEKPVMIEEGKEWENHQRSRTHRRMSRKTNWDRKVPSESQEESKSAELKHQIPR
jgi:tRNA dimethylallyltransferase